ncbi:MAG: hypothetical protein CML47_05675 [Rhodobacteraceae bacterium]|nr:MAG: hypothetical protein CML47_05675 [Paracoccaceae bacterium]|tara:strand:+ start:15752 stop:16573 length:822 start_codon:yes stop_codon:yes gene_type:complete
MKTLLLNFWILFKKTFYYYKMVYIKVLKQKIFDIKNKKIVSFCLFNDTKAILDEKRRYNRNRNYQNGIFMNYVLSKKFYPGWICRFYIDSTVEPGVLSKLDSLDLEYIYIETDINKMSLRFLPFDDKNVDVWISRDLDSAVNSRESTAVDEWLNEPESIHVMHDHPAHDFNILGGMFGAKNKHLESFYDFYLKLSTSTQNSQEYGIDCDVLDIYVKKYYENDIMFHGNKGRPFKTKSQFSHFVGSQFWWPKSECTRICNREKVDNLYDYFNKN